MIVVITSVLVTLCHFINWTFGRPVVGARSYSREQSATKSDDDIVRWLEVIIDGLGVEWNLTSERRNCCVNNWNWVVAGLRYKSDKAVIGVMMITIA